MKWKQNHNNEFYIEHFNSEVLDDLDPIKIIKEIYDYVSTLGLNYIPDICFICYEKPGDFCHRHLVAEWLRRHGIACEEYKF